MLQPAERRTGRPHHNTIEEITPDGIRTTTADHHLDVLVLATGFDANTGGLTAIDLRGPDGTTLAEAWNDGVDTHLGMAVAGFPNLLFLYGPQSATAFCNAPSAPRSKASGSSTCSGTCEPKA